MDLAVLELKRNRTKIENERHRFICPAGLLHCIICIAMFLIFVLKYMTMLMGLIRLALRDYVTRLGLIN